MRFLTLEKVYFSEVLINDWLDVYYVNLFYFNEIEGLALVIAKETKKKENQQREL